MAIPWKEQYKHPLWQKKRLEAMQRAEFTCDSCCDGNTQLHVHHRRYVKGRAIWEYELDELSVLCEPCHEAQHAEKDRLFSMIVSVPEIINPMRDITALVAGFYCGNWGVSGAVDMEEVFEGAKFQFTVGVIAGALFFDQPHRETLEKVYGSCSEIHATKDRWKWIERGLEFLKELRDQHPEMYAPEKKDGEE